MNDILWITVEALIKIVVIATMAISSAAVSVYLERRISGVIQNRYGPNRVGPFGTLQPIVDVVKLFMKEDIVPDAANKNFHRAAPIISLGVAIAVYAVIPFGSYIDVNGHMVPMGIAPDVNIGILYVLAMTSVGVYGLALAGWSSNNKYSLMGGLRSAAQMISYELSMGLAIIAVVLISGSLSLNGITEFQAGWGGWRWMVFLQPLGFIIFMISSFAEANRAPFDLPEAEPELVGGFNTEYSGMKFGMFFLAEYINLATAAAMLSLLYFGGWNIPFDTGLEPGSIGLAIGQFVFFLMKVVFFIIFFIWVRWTVPRFRYDQLMNLGWKVLLPLAIFNVVVTAVGVYIFNN